MLKEKYKDLVIATRNPKKKQEIIRLLGRLDINIWSLADFKDMSVVVEDGFSFDENAVKKALAAARHTGMLALADDSGLEVDALGGEPGIYSSRYSGPDADDQANNRKLLTQLKGVPPAKRTARYRCSVAVADPGENVRITRGECFGYIAQAPSGKEGFGYDPLFVIPRFSKTIAQLGSRIKDKISHRAKAVHLARRIILRYL